MPAKAKRAPRPDFTAAPEPAAPPPPAFGAFTTDDLTSSFQCRFICTEAGEPVRWCGAPTAPRPSGLHSSWCADHLPIVFDMQRSVGRASPKKGRG